MGDDTKVRKTLASRDEAFGRLEAFLPHAGGYANKRHVDLAGHPHVSGLSAHLRHRLILEEEVVARVYATWAPHEVTKFIEEVCWRTYWKGWLEMHPSVWRHYRESVVRERSMLERDHALQQRWMAAVEGRTGIDGFDHWAREVVETGYLHNHARMWFASIWIFTLRLPWSLGAAFFMRHLLDGDAASNTLSWRWVAGLHTVGKHYVACADNIARHTQGRFHPRGQLDESPQPLTENAEEFPRVVLAALPTGTDACQPPLSESPAGFLHTPEDLSPEIGALADAPFSSEALFSVAAIDAEMGYTARVRAFQRAAMDDAAARAAVNWAGSVEELSDVSDLSERPPCGLHAGHAGARVYRGHVPNWEDAVVAWAMRENLRTVRCYRPPVGPWRDRLPKLREQLAQAGVALREYRRSWDALHWPHARTGYFRFKKKLGERLRDFVVEKPLHLEYH